MSLQAAKLGTPLPVWSFAQSTWVAALAYFLAAKLGLLMSLPSGHISPLWPAAGVAFLLVQQQGSRCMLGIALGSLLSLLTSGPEGTDILVWFNGQAPLWPFIAIATGAAMQARLGVWLVHLVVRKAPAGAFSPWALLRILFRASLLACLLNATIASLSLPLLTAQAWSDRLPLALVWWVGDSLGVLSFLPVVLWRLRAPDLQRKTWRAHVPAIVAMSVAALSWLTAIALNHGHQQTTKNQQSILLTQFSDQVQSHFNQRELLLESFRAFFESSTEVTQPEFARFSKPWLDSDDSVSAIGWAPVVTDAQRVAFEAMAPGYQHRVSIQEMGPDNQLVPAATRAQYWPLTLFAPATNVAVRGFDLGSEPQRRETLLRASAQERPTTSGGLQLVDQMGSRATSLLLMRQVSGTWPGILVAAVRLNALIEQEISQFHGQLPTGTHVALIDHQDRRLLEHTLLSNGTLQASNAPAAHSSRIHHRLKVADRFVVLDVALPTNNQMLGSTGWWLGQLMPTLFAVLLGVALVNSTLRQEYTQKLEGTLNQLAHAAGAITREADTACSQPEANHLLAEAWANRQWAPRYSPTVDLDSGALRAVTCTPCWPAAPANLTAETQAEWIKNSGHGADIALHCLETMLEASRNWSLRRGDKLHFTLPVSVSALTQAGWPAQLLAVLAAHRLPGGRLYLLLDERECQTANQDLLNALLPLRDAGLRIGLAVSGAGQSVLATLRWLPVNRLVLDRELIARLTAEPRVADIVRTLVKLTSTHSIELVADGVDDQATAVALMKLGCPLAQGELFPPLGNAAAITEALGIPKHWWVPAERQPDQPPKRVAATSDTP